MNNFEKHIKDQMQNFAPAPPPAAWAGVSAGVGSGAAAKVGGKLLMKWIAGVLITGGVVTTVVIYTQSDSTQQNSQTQQTNTIITSPDKISESNIDKTTSSNSIQNSSENKATANIARQENKNTGKNTNNPAPTDRIERPSNNEQVYSREGDQLGNEANKSKKEITVIPAPAKMNLSDYTLCPDQMLNVKLSNCQGCSINWGDGESEQVNASEVKHSYTKEGRYIISVKGVSESVTVKKPVFNFEASLLNSTTVLYKISNPDNIDLKVDFSDGSSEITNKKEIKHTLSEGELKAEFSTTTYCKVVNETLIKSTAIQPLIPDAFTPNSDGKNDSYEIDFKDATLKFYQLVVSDDKGQIVFTSNKQNAAWDGNFNGMPMPAGIYTIQLNYQHEQFEQAEQPVKKQIFLFRK